MSEIDQIRKLVEELSKEKLCTEYEDYCSYDFFGGNFDDAYSSGREDGRVVLAREILAILKEKS